MRRIQEGLTTVLGRLFGSASAQRDAASEPKLPPAPSAGADGTFHLDVRAAIAQGREPLDEILQLARRVPDDGTLTLEAPFNPVPLRRMLNELGFVDEATQVAPDHWQVVFRRTEEAAPAQANAPRIWHTADSIHIDVRGLTAPAPMVEILKLVDSCSAVAAITVHHEREPVFLYPELAQRGWSHAVIAGGPDEVVLLLRREVKS